MAKQIPFYKTTIDDAELEQIKEVLNYKSKSKVLELENEVADVPRTYLLKQNYPNPFNGSSFIEYYLPEKTNVSLEVYNVKGQLLETLVSKTQQSGSYKVPFDATNYSSGVYFYTLKAGNHVETKKMLIVK